MMQAIRGRAGSIIIKVLFGMLIVSFGFWGVYTRSDYFQGHSPETVVATVGDQSIRADDLQRALQQALERLRAQFGGAIDTQQIKQLGILDNLLAQLVDRSLLDQQAERLGLEVSDDTVRRAIFDNPAFRGPDGQFDRQLFGQVLAMNRLSEDQLVARLRRDLPRADLVQAITAGVDPPRSVVDALYRYRNEKRVADIVAFPVASITDIGTPSDDELNKFYEAHQELFRAPEYRSVTVASLSPGDVVGTEPVPEDKLRSEYEQRKDELETPEQREIQHILAPSEEKAKEAQAALAAGKDLKEVAAIVGQNPDTIDLGLLNRQEIPSQLGDVAFQLPLNQPSDPVKVAGGWHILRVIKIEAATTQTFEQAKDKISSEIKLQEAADKLSKIGNTADDALAGGMSLDEAAEKFGLKLAKIESVDESGNGPDGKPMSLPVAPADLLKTVFSTSEHDTSRITDTDDGAIYAIHLDKVTAPQVRPLSEVKEVAVAAWQAEQKRETATKRAEALAASAGADKPLAAVAAEQKLTVMPGVAVGRGQNRQQNAPPALVAKLFAAKQSDVATVSDATGAYAAQLKEIQTPEAVSDEAAAALSKQLSGEAKGDIADEFTEALRKRFPVEVKRDALERMF